MKIIKTLSNSEISSIEDSFIQECQKETRTSWNRRFFLKNLDDERIAIISLNIFERIAWTLQEFFGYPNYFNFETVFQTKNIKIILPSDLKTTAKKVDDQHVTPPVNNTDSHSDEPIINKEESVENTPNTIPVQNVPPKEEPVISTDQQIQQFMKEGNLQKATEIIQTLPLNEWSHHYCNIARFYFQQGDLNTAMSILDSKVSMEIREPIYLEFALSFCRKGQYSDSIIAAKKVLLGSNAIAETFLQVAKEHYQNNNYEKALETIDNSGLSNVNTEPFEELYLDIADRFEEQDELDKAIDVLNRIKIKYDLKCDRLANLARKLFQKGELQKAYGYNSYAVNDYPAMKELYIQIAEAYETKKNRVQAFEVISRIANHGRLIQKDMRSAVERHISRNNYRDALETVRRSPIIV